MKHWRATHKFNPRAVALADRHYSRVSLGAPQFMPPGESIVLLTHEATAVWGWWRPGAGQRTRDGFDAWTCTIFRNESPILSSELVLDAEQALAGHDIGPDGLLTYVWDDRVRSENPGYCFKRAGWRPIGRSVDGCKTLLQKFP